MDFHHSPKMSLDLSCFLMMSPVRMMALSGEGPVDLRPHSASRALDDLAAHFSSQLLPRIGEFIENPPVDPEERDSEYRDLIDCIAGQIVLKLEILEIVKRMQTEYICQTPSG